MAASNMLDPFFADIVAVFLGNAWQTNVVNNSVTFQGTENSTITFFSAPNASIVIEGQIGVTFYLPPTAQVNPISITFSLHLFESQYMREKL